MIHVKIVFAVFVLHLCSSLLPLRAQSGEWTELPNSPWTGRHNDVSFISESNGWIVNGAGEIYRTVNGGSVWRLVFSNSETHFRSVGFMDENLGWAGSVGLGEFGNTDPVVLRQTEDGGQSWHPVESFDGSDPVGLCGMQVVNDSIVVAVGRVRGPAVFAKTTDRGETWSTVKIDSLAAGLIDVHFFTPDSGYAVGLTNSNPDTSSGVVLVTSDGGETWQKRFTTSRKGEWFWKISFPTRDVGYVSLQRNKAGPQINFVKTTDGGLTWEEKLFSNSYYFVQGIGFLTEDLGWIGGNSRSPVMETSDGGETWHSLTIMPRLNRFRFLGDTLAYSVGRKVYRYEVASPVAATYEHIPDDFTLHSSYPNPFSESTAIRFSLGEPARVSLFVTDVAGRLVRTLLDESPHSAGRHSVAWDGKSDTGADLSSGLYLYTLSAGQKRVSKSVLLVKSGSTESVRQ